MVELADLVIIVSVIGGFVGIFTFFLKMHSDTKAATTRIELDNAVKFTKIDGKLSVIDNHLIRNEACNQRIEKKLDEHLTENKPVVEAFNKSQIEIAIINQSIDQLRKTTDVHTAEINDLQDR